MQKGGANNSAAAQAQEIERRRLVPIYETLEAGNSKKALKDINTYLKKTPKSQQARCCKAIILEKIGGMSEACYKLCVEVMDEQPTDPSVLNQLRIAFTRLGKIHANTVLTEQLAAADPNSKDKAKNVFYAYIREMQFKQSQEQAVRLWKKFASEKHFYWSVACNFLQAGGVTLQLEWTRLGPWAVNETKPASIAPVDTRLLGLCDAMMGRRFAEHPPTHPGVVLLYLSVLATEGKFEQALQFLESAAGDKITVIQDKKKYKAQIHARLSQWDKVHEIAKDYLTSHNADDWGACQTFTDSLFLAMGPGKGVNAADKEKSEPFSSEDEAKIEAAFAFFKELHAAHPQCRGPLLAALDLEGRILVSSGKSKQFLSMVEDYFAGWSYKLCCFNDLKQPLDLIKAHLQSDIPQLVSALSARAGNKPATETPHVEDEKKEAVAPVGFENTSGGASRDRFQTLATLEEIKRYLGLHQDLSASDRAALGNELWNQYLASNAGLKKEVTENGPGDNLALLTAHLLYDLYRQTADNKFIFDAIILLEYARLNAKFNAQIKLLLMHLYNVVGAAQAVHEIYLELEVKHIQMDSLSYLTLEPLCTYGLYEKATALCQKIRRFHDARRREIPDYMVGPFRSQNYIKVHEFVHFAQKLENSQQLAITRVEEVFLTLHSLNDQASILKYLSTKQTFSSSSAKPFPTALQTTQEYQDALSSNQDKTVYVKWDPPYVGDVDPFFINKFTTPLTSANILCRSRSVQLSWLRLRALSVKLLAAAAPPFVDEDAESVPAAPAGRGKGGKNAAPAQNAPKEPVETSQPPTEIIPPLLSDMTAELSSLLGVESKQFDEPPTDNADFVSLNWVLLLSCHRASYAIHRLVAAGNKAGDAEQEEAKKQLTLLCSYLSALNAFFAKTFAGTGEKEAEPKSSANCYSIPQLNAYTVESLGIVSLLLQCWLVIIPDKKRKGNTAKLFQAVRAAMQKMFDSIQEHFTLIQAVIKDVGELPKVAALLPVASQNSVISFLQCKEDNLRRVSEESMQKITGSYAVSLHSIGDVINARQVFLKGLRAQV